MLKLQYPCVLLLGLCAQLPLAHATDLLVNIRGVTADAGQIGCSLFQHETGFPMDASRAQQLWMNADSAHLTCQFKQLAPGQYAVAVMQDVNLNKKVDTNFVGIPKEAWGVSNNVRPGLRAPKFNEAMIQIGEQGTQTIMIEVAK